MSSMSTSWQGTEYNERLFNGVRNALVGIYLDGVKGISPDRGHHQVPIDKADAYIEKARAVFAKLVMQIAPRAVKGRHSHQVDELSRLINKAVAVRNGAPQKMTASDYANLLRR